MVHKALRNIPEKPTLKHIVIGLLCIIFFIALIVTAVLRYYPTTWQTSVISAQKEAEQRNGKRQFMLEYSVNTHRYGYALLKATDGSALYVVAVAEKAPLFERYSESIYVMDATIGHYSELG
jgi:hypothetical protein